MLIDHYTRSADMSDPIPGVTTASSLGQQIAQAEAPLVVSPVETFLADLEAMKTAPSVAAADAAAIIAATKFLAAEAAAGVPGMLMLQGITAHWLRNQLNTWLQAKGLMPKPSV
jgi:hypothetical protein